MYFFSLVTFDFSFYFFSVNIRLDLFAEVPVLVRLFSAIYFLGDADLFLSIFGVRNL